ncbi:aspartyl/glutamyl-tRNA(Asn/Gln) amidotransferase subunit C [Peptoniphilus asaccharolyticus DSM 20463]|uniref:Aspartyl/glutamyl-tRNA(Asn/Gln) amidotransferase subunit C n=1 Tax=Peptoniphilus asaccharolyticus DSM 20463 TaxID=573058 RepID=A0A1W1UNI3_PEPAS|nr:Asp-tRNA(Asn)/Glu-tRNA(Gln) amidotransferase subunit GatC [Peptoniphilus asaccharolyticus]MBL7574961.1 Asp-tRNA(Asn)/Glu-tRNA(Gln) amidotransferase subunit GatC [Peptoniphilus asaccharolyticus]SMB82646.1 aspartyl/glutamyl-tRNA(Asn/Gln) amidotransferase subunit C [Peptoniphilus asaccharolyticus DSM 20463]
MNLEEIKHIADIAMIEFTEEELNGFQENFNETFGLIDEIKNLNLEELDMTFHVNDTVNNLRADEIKNSLEVEEATKNTAEEKYGYFKIIKFVE